MPARNLALTPEADAIIGERPGQTKGPFASAAIEFFAAHPHAPAVLELHERRWRDAYARLLGAGWTKAAMLAACDALNGHFPAPAWIAAELADAERLNGTASKWDVPPDEWARLVRMCHDHPATAQAVLDLTQAFWLPDPAVERVLR